MRSLSCGSEFVGKEVMIRSCQSLWTSEVLILAQDIMYLFHQLIFLNKKSFLTLCSFTQIIYFVFNGNIQLYFWRKCCGR